MRIVLASTSPYRRALLARLGVPFTTVAPDVDEHPMTGETPRALALRLARAKADAAVVRHVDALVIGCDQVVACGERVFGKPGDSANAAATLRALSGRTADFLTALCVINARSGRVQIDVVPFAVTFRHLGDAEVDAYVARDRPFDCAGAFRSEGLGIALVREMRGDDPNALVGLPLIRLVDFLAAEGISVLRG